eukprot:1997173-Rhodomonas_salina.5
MWKEDPCNELPTLKLDIAVEMFFFVEIFVKFFTGIYVQVRRQHAQAPTHQQRKRTNLQTDFAAANPTRTTPDTLQLLPRYLLLFPLPRRAHAKGKAELGIDRVATRLAQTARLMPRMGWLRACTWTVSYTHLTLPTICSV